ncbi:response regulator transcription factor [Erysipelothrix rhusiopathiae]|nr:response regulator transcription factor [Erysipelothrix rhusiopathiae]MDE8293181.1 response regulator transcription factor [Erysipelothrix rhusiopathiae]
MKKILIVEDDQEISKMLELALGNSFDLEMAYSGREGVFLVEKNKFDLILLDLMLPGLPGEVAINHIKNITSAPIIIMSALTDSEKIIQLLNSGANDYVTKPFDINVLVARINAQLRINKNKHTLKSNKIEYGNISIDMDRLELKIYDKLINLSNKEIKILHILACNSQKTFSKAELYEKVWEDEYMYDENTVNVHISSIRKKIKKVIDGYDPLETIWGIGVRIRKEEEL